jgi:hypothetical protein
MPQPGGVPAGDADSCRALGEAVSGQGGDYDVEAGSRQAVCGRIGQAGDEREELGEAAWPSVRQNQWDPVAAACPLVHEVDTNAVELSPEVVEGVQRAFLRSPIKAVRPVRQQSLEVRKIRALLPWRVRRRLWPPGVFDATAEVGKSLVAHPNAERLGPERFVHRPSLAEAPERHGPVASRACREVDGLGA